MVVKTAVTQHKHLSECTRTMRRTNQHLRSSLLINETDDDGDGYVECTIDNDGWDGDAWVVGGDDCSDSNGSVHTVLSYYLDSDGDGLGHLTLKPSFVSPRQLYSR